MRLVVAASLAALASADCYFHTPRGSNNRLDDENRDRNNGNRMFDSQNNNRGGANVGNIYYYQGSEMPMEWSVQHSCGGANNHCEMIVQYMCDDKLRDGTTQATIPINKKECYDWDCDSDVRFGRHESLAWYKSCQQTSRNMGLFTSSQKLKGNAAIYTRQNPNGNRRGLECPEERDYYPYWRPSPWVDLAILTNDPAKCPQYKLESENVKSRFFCQPPLGIPKIAMGQIPITSEECAAWQYQNETSEAFTYGLWTESPPHGVDPPLCIANIESRDNHHGNTVDGQWTGFNWTVPTDLKGEACAMRIRYNISTGDHEHLNSELSSALAAGNNSLTNRGKEEYAQLTDIADRHCLDTDDGYEREYRLQNNPVVDSFGSILEPDDGEPILELQLAVNTAQFGRTFEDRTHRMAFREPPAKARSCSKIHNVQVRGKRGNIVQTYPGTEYDFTPNRLECGVGACVHFQWTGSNTNPNNNAGQGRQGSDRSNAVKLDSRQRDEKSERNRQRLNADGYVQSGLLGMSYPAHISEEFLGMDRAMRQKLALLEPHFGGELSELDDAGVYFDSGIIPCTKKAEGIYHYMSTRNNNFSNRSQKGTIVITSRTARSAVVSPSTASSIDDGACKFSMAQGSVSSACVVTVNCDTGAAESHDASIASTCEDSTFEVSMKKPKKSQAATMWYSATGEEGTFSKVEADCSGATCTTNGSQDGVYRILSKPAWAVIIPLSLVGLIVLGLGIFFTVRCVKSRNGGGASNTASLRNHI